MRVGLITTVDTNLGDDLIRWGALYVLEDLLGTDVEYVMINKHDPLTVFPAWHPVRSVRRLPVRVRYQSTNLASKLLASHTRSRFDDCDIIVQCGAPVLWENCHRCEWAQPLWYGVIERLYDRTPVLNLAAGSCYPLERLPSSLVGSVDEPFVYDITRMSAATTSRDRLAHRLFRSVGAESTLLPCTAFLSARGRVSALDAQGPILVSYMRGGGHYDFEQNVDVEQWRRTVVTVIERLARRHDVIFLCHDNRERVLAQSLGTGLRCIVPRSEEAYFDAVSIAKGALCNRLHAAVALAGEGIPAVAVGTDSRMMMIDELGLKSVFAKDCTAPMLEELVEVNVRQRFDERDRLVALAAETFGTYRQVCETAIDSRRVEH